MSNTFFQLGYKLLFPAAKNKSMFKSIFFETVSTSLGRSQCYFYWLSKKYSLKPISKDASIICLQIIPSWSWKSFTYIFTWKTELFDLIRNNVANIIKPEEVDDLIK